MNARRLPTLVLVATVVLAGASGFSAVSAQATHEVRSVVLDSFRTINPVTLQTPPCDGGQIDVSSTGFLFHEVPEGGLPSAPGMVGQPEGYISTGCGTAILDVTGPRSYDHFHVRFVADRQIIEFQPGGLDLNPSGWDFTQELQFRAPTGEILSTTPFFDVHLQAAPATSFDIRGDFLGPSFQVAWLFSDNGAFLGPGQSEPTSGEDYKSDVANITLEFSGIPFPYNVSANPTRHGNVFLTETTVTFDAKGLNESDVRLDVLNTLAFSHVVAPDGARIDEATTRNGAGPDQWDRSFVLEEGFRSGLTWITVPKEFVAAHGDGEYRVVFTSVDTLEAEPTLIPLVLLILALPLPFAAMAYRKVRAFEKEAFGAYKRSARNLRIALVVAALYYLTVVVASLVAGGVEVLLLWPIPLQAIITYVQVAVAIAAFIALYTVARELDSITHPKHLQETSPP